MTTRTTLLIVALSLVIVHGRINANELAAPETDLYTLYTKAIAQDPEIRAARAAKAAASEALPQARSGLLPNLSLSAEHGRYEQRTEAVRGFSPARENHYSRQILSANLSQALFDLPAWYRYQAGKSLKREADAEYTDALQFLGERLSGGGSETAEEAHMIVGDTIDWGAVGAGLAAVSLGIGIAATPIGWVGATGAALFSLGGGYAIGTGLTD